MTPPEAPLPSSGAPLPATPFQSVSHRPPRLSWRQRLDSLLGAVALALVVLTTIVVLWDWHVKRLRAQAVIEPIQVWYEPE